MITACDHSLPGRHSEATPDPLGKDSVELPQDDGGGVCFNPQISLRGNFKTVESSFNKYELNHRQETVRYSNWAK